MTKRKMSVIAVAILVCIVCISMIAGATFALFTDNDSVNISVTTASLDVEADVDEDSIEIGYNGTGLNERLTATYADKQLTVNNMLPGDVIKFNLNVVSKASVNVKYRVSYGFEGDETLSDQLLLGVKDSDETDYTYYISSVSDWKEIAYSDSQDADQKLADMTSTQNILLELPAYVTDAQNKTCKISVAVEAVQGNASGEYYEAPGEAVKAYRLNSADLADNAITDEVLDGLKNGSCLVLDGADGQDWSITTDFEGELSVRGGKVGTLTVDAPNATIHYYVDYTEIINVEHTAGESFHVHGEVAQSLTVNEGRVVVEETANVSKATVVVAPEVGVTAIIEAKTNVKELKTEGEGVANVKVAEDVVIGNLKLDNKNEDTVVNNEGTIEKAEGENIANLSSKVTTSEQLKNALAIGGNVVLEADIVTPAGVDCLIEVPEGVTAVLDLNGHKFVSNYYGRGFVNRGNLTINDSVGTGMVYNDSGKEGVDYEKISTNAITNETTGVLVINGGRFGDDDFDDDNDNNTNWGAAVRNLGVATINGGYFTCQNNNGGYYSYAIRSENELTINGGKVYGNMNGGIAADAGTLTINDGEFYCVKSWNWHVVATSSGAQVTITGGKFEAGSEAHNNLLGGFSGMPSWDASGALEVNGYTVSGGEFVAHVKNATQLNNALGTPANLPNYTIVLDGDIDYGTGNILIENDITLDLNGHTVTGSAAQLFWIGYETVPNVVIKNGNIVSKSDGSTSMAVYSAVNSTVTLENVNISGAVHGIYTVGSVNINGGTIEASQRAVFVYVANFGYDEVPAFIPELNVTGAVIKSGLVGLTLHTAKATLSDTEITIESNSMASGCVLAYRNVQLTMTECTVTNPAGSGVIGNGTRDTSNFNCGIGTNITLNNCTINALMGIYHPQIDGVLTVNGGEITGSVTGIEVRAGSLVLNGANVSSTYSDTFSIIPNGTGSTISGAALGVSQHTTNEAISVTVNGSTLTGIYALFEKDIQDDNHEGIIISLEGTNTFNGKVYSENCDLENEETDISGEHVILAVNSEARLTAALADADCDGVMLTANITVTNNIVVDNREFTIDLNKKTLSRNNAVNEAFVIQGGAQVTFKNGKINYKSSGAANVSGMIYVKADSSAILDGVEMTSNQCPLFAESNAAKIEVKNNSVITGSYYAIGTNASEAGQYVAFNLVDSTFKVTVNNGTPVFVSVPSNVVINNCDIYGKNQAVLVRTGIVTIENSRLYNDATALANYGSTPKWSTGTYADIGILVVGNGKSAGTGYGDITLNIKDTQLINNAQVALPYVFCVYGDGNHNVTVTYEGLTITQGENAPAAEKVVYFNNNNFDGAAVTVNGNVIAEETVQATL